MIPLAIILGTALVTFLRKRGFRLPGPFRRSSRTDDAA
jgi:hypothetical protein